jgi:stearoyl-CoA desaturase (delta-9 desaturase)
MIWQCGGQNNVGDLEKQPFYKFMQNTYFLHPIALGVLLYAVGGFPFLVWGMVWNTSHVLLSHFFMKIYRDSQN